MDRVRLDTGPDANVSVVVAIDTETGIVMGTCLGIVVAGYKCLYRSLNKVYLMGPLYVFLRRVRP